MSSVERSAVHDEVWLLLPWAANGRLSNAERERVEEHARACATCAEELAVQCRLCDALSAPERVTYAPGPSFRKLLDRLEAPATQAARTETPRADPVVLRPRKPRGAEASLWRPPGLAWAASFIVMVGMTALVASAYRWTEPRYTTRTNAGEVSRPDILHIAFDRGLSIGEVEQVLHASGARVVEGPDSTGIFGVSPASGAGPEGAQRTVTSRQMFDLASRLRADPRIRWVEPVDVADTTSRPVTGTSASPEREP